MRRKTSNSMFQSTLPVGGATMLKCIRPDIIFVSIHAPRGGSDLIIIKIGIPNEFQSTLPVGGATKQSRDQVYSRVFQSTLPVGGATPKSIFSSGLLTSFNPRSPWGERLHRPARGKNGGKFQSTLPVGGATLLVSRHSLVFLFQSTLPVGGATSNSSSSYAAPGVSIHAPRGGSDDRRGLFGR